MPNTPHGYPYPVGTDLISNGDDVMRSLGQALDSRAGASASGSAVVVISAQSDPANVAVTFPAGRFATAPYPTVTAITSVPQNCHVSVSTAAPVTTAGFTITGTRTVGAGNITVHWQAEAV
jgi:hypothetical protein